jgi:hypothetical protein
MTPKIMPTIAIKLSNPHMVISGVDQVVPNPGVPLQLPLAHVDVFLTVKINRLARTTTDMLREITP